ncbi:amidohydrolase [Kitasatospora acidiphila]|uniref:amidohydrolase n=1 Tax=Kitasatospora acidiphila TaxID=2567942 RepID=UPI001E5D936D|nr:amidohydrolase [Kitasatospora acidiphila]
MPPGSAALSTGAADGPPPDLEQPGRPVRFGTAAHDPETLRLLRAHASPDRIVCGSDYPFDMAQPDPVRFPLDNGMDAAVLEANGRAFLGAVPEGPLRARLARVRA